MNLPDEDSAFHYLAKLVNQKEGLVGNPLSFNRGRHMVLQTLQGNNYYCLFKREFFMTFGDHFPTFIFHNPNLRGVAESINDEWLEKAIKLDAILLFIHPDAKVYWAYPMMVKKLGLVRKQESANVYNSADYSGQETVINEVTYHVPVKLLKRYDVV